MGGKGKDPKRVFKNKNGVFVQDGMIKVNKPLPILDQE